MMFGLLGHAVVFGQVQPADTTESKLKFADKIGHWLVAYGISSPEYMDTVKNDFKSRAFAQVYIEGIIDHDAWMFNLLNRITKFRYQEKQTPNIVFEVKFQPENKEVMDSYKLVLSVRTNGNERNDLTRILDEAVAEHISNTRYPDPEKALADIESTIQAALHGIAEKLGTELAPDLMVRYQNEIFWDGHEISIMEDEGNFVEIEAVNKNGNLLSASEVIWTNADPFESKGVVDLTGIDSKQVTLTKRSDSTAMTVTVKRFNATENINELLKELIVAALSGKRQEIADTIIRFRQDSVDNLEALNRQLALLESDNMAMEGGGLIFQPMFDQEQYFPDSARYFLSDREKVNGFNLLKKHRRIHERIRRKVNVAAFADLVVDQPEKIDMLLDELLKNSGRLIARLILNRDSQGQRDGARDIVIDFLNSNLERIAGGHYPPAKNVVQPLPPVIVTVNLPTYQPGKLYHISSHVNFPGRTEFEDSLKQYLSALEPPLFVTVNYSQDIQAESFQQRAIETRPVGLPDEYRYASFTLVNVPGSVKYQLFSNYPLAEALRNHQEIGATILRQLKEGTLNPDCDPLLVKQPLRDLATKAKLCDNYIFNTTDNNLSDIPEEDFRLLCVEQRLDIIKCVDNFPSAGSDDRVLLAVLKTTPEDQIPTLMSRLHSDRIYQNRLIEAIDGEEFLEFVNLISGWLGEPTQDDWEEAVIAQKLLYFDVDDAFWGGFDKTGTVNVKARKNFHIGWYQEVSFTPHDMVAVVFTNDMIIGRKEFKQGDQVTMSGLAAYSLFNESENKKIRAGISIAFDIPLMFVGIGEIRLVKNIVGVSKAIRALRYAKATTDIIVATGGLAMAMGLEDQLKVIEGGETILQYWTWFNLIYAGATLSPRALAAGRGLYNSCKLLLFRSGIPEAMKNSLGAWMRRLKDIFQKQGHNIDDLGEEIVDFSQLHLRQVMEGADDWRMVFYKDHPLGDAIVTDLGTRLELDIVVPKAWQGKGVLKEIFRKAVEIFDPVDIKATWKVDPEKYAEFGGVSTNYKVFFENAASAGNEAAALLTPTGKAVAELGFRTVNSVSITADKQIVTVIFGK